MKKYGKLSLSLLLTLLVVLSLSLTALAEESERKVSAAEAIDNSIVLVSIDSTAFNCVDYTIRLSVTPDLAREGYCLGMQISNNPDFQHGQGKYVWNDGETPRTDAYDNEELRISRSSVCMVPGSNITYYLRPVLYESTGRFVIDVGNSMQFSGPDPNSQYTDLNLGENYDSSSGWLYGKFTASQEGWYALTAGSHYDFISFVRPDFSESSSIRNENTDDMLKLFFHANQNETVYVFGTPPNNLQGESIRIVPAADAAPTENSIEVGDAMGVTNMGAQFPFTVSTTMDTAQSGYQVGIIYGEHGTDPSTWEDTIRINMPETSIKSSTQKTYGNSSMFVPEMDIDYQAALFDPNSDHILARGDYVGHLVTGDNVDNMGALTIGGTAVWTDRVKPFYFEVTQSGLYHFSGVNMNSIKVLNQACKTRADLGGQNEYTFNVYAKAGETIYVYPGNNRGIECSLAVTYDSSRIADTQQLLASINAGETYLNLNEYGSFEITDDVTIPSNATLSFDGTKLAIDPGVTLTILGNAHGQTLNISGGGMLQVEGEDDSHWAVVYADEIICAGDATSIMVGDRSTLNMNFYGWNESVASHIGHFEGSAVVLHANVYSEEEYQDAHARINSFNNYGVPVSLNMNINYPCELVDGTRLSPLCRYFVNNDGDSNQGSLTVPAGATVTMPSSRWVELCGASFTVNGTLVNDGVIVLRPRDDWSAGADFVLAEGAAYQGAGEIRIRNAQGYPEATCNLNVAFPYGVEKLWNNVEERSCRIVNFTPAATDSISITGITNLLGASVYMNVSMSISAETAATECYRGIQYSTDPTFGRYDIWGHDPVTHAFTDYVVTAELAGLVPDLTYYYRAVLFHDTENGWEVFVQETGEPHTITITESDSYSVTAITMDETTGTGAVTVDPDQHVLYRFIAPADSTYVVAGTGLDYTIAIDAAGNRMKEVPQHFWTNDAGESCQSVYFWANEGETWYFSVGSYNESESTLQLRLSFAMKDPATTPLALDTPVITTSSNLPWCFTAETAGFYHIGIDHPEFGGLAYPLGGNNWGRTGQYFTELAAGESFFFILEFDEVSAENAGGMTVSVHSLDTGLAEIMENAASNPASTFHTVISGGTLRYDLTIPFNVSLDIEGEWKLADGVTLNNYGDLHLLDGGTLNFGSAATLNLKDDAAHHACGWLTLEGGTLNVPENAMSFEGSAGLEIRNSRYVTNQAALAAVTGIQNEKIHLESSIRSQEEYDYWYDLAATEGYRSLNLCLENALSIMLTKDLPDEYGIVVNGGTGVTVPENAEIRLSGFLAMEGGSFINNGNLTVDRDAEINIWQSGSTVVNNGSLQLYGSLRNRGIGAMVTNNGDFIVMTAMAIPSTVSFSPNLYHYPEDHRLVLPAALTTVEAEAFANTSTWEIVLPAAVTGIGENAFGDSDDLCLVVIPNRDTEITGNPFENCVKVTIAAPAGGKVQSFATNAEIPFLAIG